MTDQTQPVPGIVSSQTAYASAYSRGRRAYGTSSSTLAQMLSLPAARPPRGMVTTGWILTLLGVPLAALFVLVSLEAHHSSSHPAPMWASIMAPLIMTLPLWLSGLVCLVIGYVRMSGFRRGAPLRETAWQVWSTARYCFRDHVVFLPHGAHAPAELARSLILDTAQRTLTEPYAPPPLRA
ncbi:hypothetical protein [Actinoallomurus rhizosphaericola]|uniref:hypothetical protein n=1 Tax=Actinoallomurus rhizosphaericola TaxID=2952536 RepID=UPI002093A0E6|nr:hypothetical protein [Actinoallomurus rhizosphaericola]MCO5996289.1 hypothetical protein [Actinoallomurus rhizosphaericola]